MNNTRYVSRQTFLILNTLLLPVFILAFIDTLNFSFLARINLAAVAVITSLLKIYVMAGLGGCILEIVSDEESVISMQGFHRNAMQLWPGFLAALLIERLIDFSLFLVFPSFPAWKSAYLCLPSLLVSVGTAYWALYQKYVKPLGISGRAMAFNLKAVRVLAAACVMELALIELTHFAHPSFFYWRNITVLLINYIHVFEFTFASIYIVGNYPEIEQKFLARPEIFLVNPMGAEVVKSLSYGLERIYPPVFVVLKALTPHHYRFREFNRRIWHERYYKSNVLVCITCFTSNSYEAYKIAKEFKNRGARVVMGGPHVTYMPQEALTFCDSVVIGPAEGVWRQVIADYEGGALKIRYSGVANEEDFHQVQQELLSSPPFVAKEFLETSRGCKFRCHFCTIPALSDGKVRVAAINDVLELIQRVRGRYHHITFLDNNIYSDPGYARELFTAIKPLKITWNSLCTIDIAKNQETLRLAHESGCRSLSIGYETFGGSVEKNQGGKFAMSQKYLEYTRTIKKAGIGIKGLFIFGFDSDNLKTLVDLWKFCFLIRPKETALSLLTPLPGSGVFRDMLTQDRIINLNWRNYLNTKLVVHHPWMKPGPMLLIFPLIQVFFLTTSIAGYCVLIILLCFPYHWLHAL